MMWALLLSVAIVASVLLAALIVFDMARAALKKGGRR